MGWFPLTAAEKRFQRQLQFKKVLWNCSLLSHSHSVIPLSPTSSFLFNKLSQRRFAFTEFAKADIHQICISSCFNFGQNWNMPKLILSRVDFISFILTNVETCQSWYSPDLHLPCFNFCQCWNLPKLILSRLDFISFIFINVKIWQSWYSPDLHFVKV